MTDLSNCAISVVAYHSCEILHETLPVLLAVNVPIHIWVNGDDDGIVKSFSSYPQVVIRSDNGKNIGFGSGHNRNLENITQDYVLVLNPDCFVVSQQIEGLIKVAEQYQNAAIVGPAFDDGTTNPRSFNPLDKFPPLLPDGDLCTGFISGACMLFNMNLMRKIGFFDENIFLFHEDDEICWRVREKGECLILTPSVMVKHIGGKSSGKQTLKSKIFCAYQQGLSGLYYYQKISNRPAQEVADRMIKTHKKKYYRRLFTGKFNKAKIVSAQIQGIKDAAMNI